jgi:hypothetical protein
VYAELTQVFADGQDSLAALNFEGFHVLSSPGNLLKKYESMRVEVAFLTINCIWCRLSNRHSYFPTLVPPRPSLCFLPSVVDGGRGGGGLLVKNPFPCECTTFYGYLFKRKKAYKRRYAPYLPSPWESLYSGVNFEKLQIF